MGHGGEGGKNDSTEETGAPAERREVLELAAAAGAFASAGLAGCSAVDLTEEANNGGDGGDGGDGDVGGDGDGNGGGGGTDSPTERPTESQTRSPTESPTESPTRSPTESPTESPTPLGDLEFGPGEAAPYHDWVVDELYDQSAAFAISIDLTSMKEPSDQQDESEPPDDPLISMPFGYAFIVLFAGGLTLGSLGLGESMEEKGSGDTFHFLGGFVLEGSFEESAVGSKIEESGAEPEGSYGGFALYRKDQQQDIIAAVSSEAIVAASQDEQIPDPMARVETLIDIANGEGTPYRSENPPFGELANALERRPVTGVTYTPEGGLFESTTPTPGENTINIGTMPSFDGDAYGMANAANLGQTMTAGMAIRFTGPGEVPDEATIRKEVAPTADAVKIAIDGPMVRIIGRYSSAGAGGG